MEDHMQCRLAGNIRVLKLIELNGYGGVKRIAQGLDQRHLQHVAGVQFHCKGGIRSGNEHVDVGRIRGIVLRIVQRFNVAVREKILPAAHTGRGDALPTGTLML